MKEFEDKAHQLKSEAIFVIREARHTIETLGFPQGIRLVHRAGAVFDEYARLCRELLLELEKKYEEIEDNERT